MIILGLKLIYNLKKMIDNLKIALLITGEPTSSFFCFPYIYNSFLNTEYKVDTFIHSTKTSDHIELYNPVKYLIEPDNHQEIIDGVMSNLVFPEEFSIEGHIDRNIMQFYTNKTGFDLIPNDYDIVIRCRPDIYFPQKINLEEIITNIIGGVYDVYCPDKLYNYGGYQDRIYIGKYEVIKKGFLILEELNYIMSTLKKWHIETFLKFQWDSISAKIYQEPLNHIIVRDVNISSELPVNFINK